MRSRCQWLTGWAKSTTALLNLQLGGDLDLWREAAGRAAQATYAET
ncbi:MAG: hypothetical protein ABJA20_04840 [Novosphingobium sp.]